MRGLNTLAGVGQAAQAQGNGLRNVLFAGPSAATADKDRLAEAEQLEAGGASPEFIWRATGWGRGADGGWRFEIDDSQSNLRRPVETYGSLNPRTLGHMLDHPGFEAAYPGEAYRIMMQANGGMRRGDASFNKRNNLITLGMDGESSASPHELTLHELQHWIQKREGWNGGADMSSAPASIRDDVRAGFSPAEAGAPNAEAVAAWRAYARNRGETEARNVERRVNMTPDQRYNAPPWQTEDFPRNKQY